MLTLNEKSATKIGCAVIFGQKCTSLVIKSANHGQGCAQFTHVSILIITQYSMTVSSVAISTVLHAAAALVCHAHDALK